MLYGGHIEYKGNPATLIFAGVSTTDMTDKIADVSVNKQLFNEVTMPSAMDRIKMKILSGLKNPITIFVHSDAAQRDKFADICEITILDRSMWEYYQEKQAAEDEMQSLRDQKDIMAMDALSGVLHHTSVAKELGIDEVDPWDTRTEKQKADDLLNSSAQFRKLVEDGILTDEAVAGAASQGGSIESAVLDFVEHIKNGGQMIDPNNIPPQFQEQIDKMIEEGNIREQDIPRFIDDLNKKVKEYCENDKLDEVMRIFGGVEIDATGTDGRIFINTKKKDQKQISSAQEKSEVAERIEQSLMAVETEESLAEILKPSTVDGTYKPDAEKYIFDNTSMDKYDLQDALTEMKSSAVSTAKTFDASNLPENIGTNSDIQYSNTSKEFAYHAKLIDEDNNIYAFFPKGIGVNISNEKIIGTTNVGIYMVTTDGSVLFTLKEADYKTAYFVVEDNGTKYVFNVNV